MPVPSSISDLSTTPALNSPPGSESPSSIDDYLRTLSAFIKQINDLAATKADASALASKADDSAVVKLTGAQTVAGTKTFSASPVAPNPTAGTRSQALATMQMFADEFAASIASNGYQKLPSGLIMQWGLAASENTITFPIAFPSAALSISSVASVTYDGFQRSNYVTTVGKTGFFLGGVIQGASTPNPASFSSYWIAFGY